MSETRSKFQALANLGQSLLLQEFLCQQPVSAINYILDHILDKTWSPYSTFRFTEDSLTRFFFAQQHNFLMTVTTQEQQEQTLAKTRARTREIRMTMVMMMPSVVLIPPRNHSIGLRYLVQARGLKKLSTTPASYSTLSSSALFLSSKLNEIIRIRRMSAIATVS